MPGESPAPGGEAATLGIRLIVLVEGSSDVVFFLDVLRDLLESVLEERSVQADVVVETLNNGETSRGQWVIDRVRHHYPDAAVVAVHIDGSADPARELRKSYQPIENAWQLSGRNATRLVPLVPVREMEAWALADLDVVREVAGADWDVSSVTDGELLGRPERLPDPKRTLSDVMRQARRPRRGKRHVDTYLPLISERLELPALRRLPSFQRFERDLRAALAPLLEM